MAIERNALAELAEDLRVMGLDVDGKENEILDKAERIVAELGKPDRIDGRIACEIMMKCRAIAEEGGAK